MAHEDGLGRFLGWRQVRDLTGLGRTTAWRMRQAGDFPEPVPISPGRVAWRERDIAAWNESRGPVIPMRPAAAKPARVAETRPPEDRAIAFKGPETEVSKRPEVIRPEAGTRRRRTSKIAEGQLGFDF